MPKLKITSNDYFEKNIFGRSIKFSNTKNQPSYIENRVNRIKSKEPETIKWLDSIPENSIFYDVGANIGIYTMCAAAKNLKTYSFEPHANNYNNLCQSISLNKFENNCSAYCVALSDKISFDKISIKNYHAGVADNQVSEQSNLSHGCITYDLDTLVKKNYLPQPSYIKIDIDGHEEKFFKGAIQTLSNCKSILFEIEIQFSFIVDELKNMGFNIIGKHKRNDTEHNYIFSK